MFTPAHLVDYGKLESGDVLLHHDFVYRYKPSTWLSGAIRYFTKSDFNHSSEVIIMDGEIFFIESLLGGISLTDYVNRVRNNYLKKEVLVLRYNKQKDFEHDKYQIKALRELDKQYDVIGLLRDMLLFTVTGLWKEKTDSESKRAWRCSEFNAYMKNLDGWKRFMPKDFSTHPDFIKVM